MQTFPRVNTLNTAKTQLLHYAYYYSFLMQLVNGTMGSSWLFLLDEDVDCRVKCPRSSMCSPQFSCTRPVQQKVAISSLTATNRFHTRLSTKNSWCTFPVQCCPCCFTAGPVFLDVFPHFLLFLFSSSLSRCQAITSHCPLSAFLLV